MSKQDIEIGGYTGKELKAAYWWVTHKVLILKIITILLVFACVGFWGYTIYGLARYFIIDWPGQQRLEAVLAQDYVDYEYWRQKNQPQDLSFSNVQIFSLGNNRYDFLVQVDNSNLDWAIASLQYSFNFTGREKKITREVFILPGQTKYLIDLGVSSDQKPSNVNLEIKNIRWQRISNFQEYQEDVLDFTVSDIKFISSEELSVGKLPVSKTKFTVKNNSAYNFWEIGFYVVLHHGSKITGINYIIKEYFDSQEDYDLEVVWYQKLSRPDKTEIIPDINVLDPSIFRPVEGGVGEIK